MRPIISWNLWQRRWLTAWWSLGISFFIVLTLAFYPSFRDQSKELEKSFQDLPEAAKSFISDTTDFLSPEGYLSSQVFYLMLPLLFSILAVGLGSSLLAKEEDSGTVEMLLGRPLSRGKLLAGKALAGLMVLIIVCLISLGSLLIVCSLVDINVPLDRVLFAAFMSLALAILLGSVAFSVTTLGRTARLASVGIAALVGFGSYIITSLSSAVEWLSWPSRVLPYHYYRPGDILYGDITWRYLGVMMLVSLLLLIIAWRFFRRRDLNG